MAAHAINHRTETDSYSRLSSSVDPTSDDQRSSSPGQTSLFRPYCRTWQNCLITTMSVFLCTGITMLIIGFIVPRSPPNSAKTELTAREYETLAKEYSKRGYLMDVVIVMGLACMVVVAVILSALHAVMYYYIGRETGSVSYCPSGRRSSCDGGNCPSSGETLAMASRRTVGYGGLDMTEH